MVVTDRRKGADTAVSHFPVGILKFLCTLNVHDKLFKCTDEQTCKEIIEAASSWTLNSLQRARYKYTEKGVRYLLSLQDEEQYPCVHGTFYGCSKGQGTESMNRASMEICESDTFKGFILSIMLDE